MNLTNESIRIGTIITCGEKAPSYIRQIRDYGFESYALNFWQTLGGADLPALAENIHRELNDSVISCLGIYGNPLENDSAAAETRAGWENLIDHAHLFNTNLICGFTGRLRGKPIHECIARFKEIFSPLVERAQKRGVKLAFENCSMGGNWQSGDWNIAHNPTAWELMFEAIPAENLGLEWEPCHQLVALIDPIPQLEKWVHKIFHVHGKDATIHWDVIKKFGVHSSQIKDPAYSSSVEFAPPYVEHRTPGFGDSNWTDIITILRRAKYNGTIDIEGWHDPVYQGVLEMTGQVHALKHLINARGGYFIANPKL